MCRRHALEPLVCSHCLGEKNTRPLCSCFHQRAPGIHWYLWCFVVFSSKDRITVSAPNGLSLAVPTTLLAAAGGSVTLSVAQLGQDSEMVQALEALENQTEEILDENLQF